jgi:hypothetical protein
VRSEKGNGPQRCEGQLANGESSKLGHEPPFALRPCSADAFAFAMRPLTSAMRLLQAPICSERSTGVTACLCHPARPMVPM